MYCYLMFVDNLLGQKRAIRVILVLFFFCKGGGGGGVIIWWHEIYDIFVSCTLELCASKRQGVGKWLRPWTT